MAVSERPAGELSFEYYTTWFHPYSEKPVVYVLYQAQHAVSTNMHLPLAQSNVY